MKDERRATKVLFAVYLFFLTWIILFKTELNIGEMIAATRFRSVNLIPFASPALRNGRPDVSEIVLNIIAFIPFGIYTSALGPRGGFLRKLLAVFPIFSVSLLYEVLQYALAIGASDVTDLIGNTLGGIIGIGAFCILRLMLKDKTLKFVNAASGIAAALSVMLLAVLIFANL